MDMGEEKCTNTQFSNHLKDTFDPKYKQDLAWALSQSKLFISDKSI